MNDTPPEVQEDYRARLLALSGGERLELAASMFESARQMVLASLASITDPVEKRRRLYERIYGESPPEDWS